MANIDGKTIFEMGVGQAKSMSPSWLLLLLLPFVPAVLKHFGVTDENGIYDKLPEPVRKFFDGIVDMFRSVKGFIRDLMHKEETTALEDLQIRIATKSTALNEIDSKLKLPGAAEYIRGMMKESAEDFFGISVSLDGKAALENTRELHGKISGYLLAQLKAKNPTHTPDDVKRFTVAANEAASFATGLTEAVGANPNNLTSGYGAQLLAFQTAVKDPSEYAVGQAQTVKLDQSLIDLARSIIDKSVTLAENGTPATRPAAVLKEGITR